MALEIMHGWQSKQRLGVKNPGGNRWSTCEVETGDPGSGTVRSE